MAWVSQCSCSLALAQSSSTPCSPCAVLANRRRMTQGRDKSDLLLACLAGWCVRKTFLHLEDESPPAASRACSEPPRRPLDLQALEAEEGTARVAEAALREALAVQWPGWRCVARVGPEVEQDATRLQPGGCGEGRVRPGGCGGSTSGSGGPSGGCEVCHLTSFEANLSLKAGEERCRLLRARKSMKEARRVWTRAGSCQEKHRQERCVGRSLF